jgi:hypothetical protein
MDASKAWVLFVGLTATISGSAMAFVAPEGSEALAGFPGEVVVRPVLEEGSSLLTNGAVVQRDARSGAARLVTLANEGDLVELAPGATLADYVAEARRFVETNRDVVLADWNDLSLVRDAVLIDGDVAFLDFDVRRNGLLVQDANVAFRFKQGRLLQVQTQSFGEAQAFVVDGADRYRVAEVKDGYVLVPVKLGVASFAGDEFVVQTDLRTGHTFEIAPTRRYADGDAMAQAYARTWFESVTQVVPIAKATLSVNNTTVLTDAEGKFTASAAPKLNGFKGTHANVVPSTGTLVTQTAVSRDNRYELAVSTTEDKALSQAMAFHHITQIANYAKRYISTGWLDRALRANVNLSQTCNAYWNGSTVNFYSAGGGCANTALISDVIYHEWGHGLDANTGGIADGAFSEGFGDIVAMIMARDSVTAPGFRLDGRGIRDLSPDKVYPRDRGEVHAEGLIIGGTFWDLYEALKAKYDDDTAIDLVSKYAFKVIFTARRYTDVYAALQVIDDDNGNLGDLTPNFCELNAAFTAHGLATADARCQ